MRSNFEMAFTFTKGQEGGYSKDKNDPGNWTGGKVGVGELKGTNHGIAANTYPDLDIKNLTLADAKGIYKRDYWDKVGADFFAPGFDLASWDYGVNSGNSRSLKDVQRVLKIGVDGKLGPETKKAGALATVADIQALCARRLSFMQSLKTWARYKNGWSKRVAAVEAKGVALFMSYQGASAAEIKGDLLDHADDAEAKANQNGAMATGTGASGGAASVGLSTTSTTALIVCAVAAAALVAFLIWKRKQNRERAEAYRAEAAAM